MTPAPQAKRMDARILSKADLDRLSSVAWNYARESAVVQVRDYLQDVASLRGHIDALEAAAAAREEQVRVLVEVGQSVVREANDLYWGPVIPHGQELRTRFDGLRTAIFDLADALAALTNGAGHE